MAYNILQADRGVDPKEELYILFELSHTSILKKPTDVRHVLITYHMVVREHKVHIDKPMPEIKRNPGANHRAGIFFQRLKHNPLL
jgi:hypothetical protein